MLFIDTVGFAQNREHFGFCRSERNLLRQVNDVVEMHALDNADCA
jgi:hypothetical protein